MSTSSYEKVAAFLTENHPDINLTTSKHDNKLVAGAVLLKNGQQLTMDKLAMAARLVGKGKGKSKGGGGQEGRIRAQRSCVTRKCVVRGSIASSTGSASPERATASAK